MLSGLAGAGDARPAYDLARAESEGLPGMLRWRMSQFPRSSVALYLERGQAVDQIPALDALDGDARAIASDLSEFARPNDRALLLYPPGLDFLRAFFGCLYAGVIAVPANMPRPGGAAARIQGILRDAEPAVVLTTSEGMAGLNYLRESAPEFRRIPWTTAGRTEGRLNPPLPHRSVSCDSIAFLQYTSGTTSASRGVMVTHRNVLAQIRQLELAWSVLPGQTYVSWLPHYHDMGLIGVLAAVYTGVRSILMSHYSFYQNPMRWLTAISEYGARVSGAPNSAYEFCVRKSSAPPAGLDLSRWEVAINGAEPVRYSTMQRFAAKFAVCGFRWEAFSPSYGLAEATLGISVSRCGIAPRVSAPAKPLQTPAPAAPPGEEALKVVDCGAPLQDVEVAIVSPATLQPCDEGEVGEIWAAGPNLAKGYWKNPEDTENTFRAQPGGESAARFLRTGDLGFLKHGNVYVSGRIKDLIIIAGRNHYPHEIEETVSQCDSALRHDSAAAFTVEIDGEERLVVAQELAHARKPEELRRIMAAIRHVVAAEHDLSVHSIRLLNPGALPRTTSGKIQRSVCREAILSGELQSINGGIE